MVLNADAYTVIENPLLSERTSIRLGGAAIAEVRLYTSEGIEQLPGLLARIGGKVRVVGEGSNVLAADGLLPLVLLNMDRHGEPQVLKEREDGVLVKVESGLRLPAFLAWAAKKGLTGLEGLAGIPGSVGGAIAMNAGSFGVETSSLLRSACVFSPDLGFVERQRDEFIFDYRHCTLPGHSHWFLIAEATFSLRLGKTEDIRAKMRDVYLKKQTSQPVAAKTAGCVFKNPSPDAPAGRLLEEAGVKGLRVGDMYFSTLHANFLVNEGKGTFAQALELIELARSRVRQQSGHELELEVQIWQ
jgi:UDP-N-acetylenolpyruvoylglucosamine reductase